MSSSALFPADESEWVLAEGENPGPPIMIRFRPLRPSRADMDRFRFLIIAYWSYEPDNSSGLPNEALSDAMREFEDRVVEASDADPTWGTCVAVKTHDGIREWRFYSPDVALFQSKFSRALDGLGPYPLEFEVFEDPEWEGLAQFRDHSR